MSKKNPNFCQNCNKEIYRIGRKFCSKKCYGQFKSKTNCIISKTDLYKLYIEERLPLDTISNQTNISISTICKYIKKYKISNRGISFNDFSNKKIGSLLVIERLSPTSGGGKHVKWKCICDCGQEYVTNSQTLRCCINIACPTCRGKSKRKGGLPYMAWNAIVTRVKMSDGRLTLGITREYLYDLYKKQNGKCAISGLDIGFAETNRKHQQGYTTASLDRKDSSIGYEIGNVQWVHKRVNIMKWDSSQDEFIQWCKIIAENNR